MGRQWGYVVLPSAKVCHEPSYKQTQLKGYDNVLVTTDFLQGGSHKKMHARDNIASMSGNIYFSMP